MTFDVVTVFPGMFLGPLAHGMLARARRAGRVGVRLHDLRRWGVGPHRQVDDATYGGGGGMVLRPEPLFSAVEWIKERYPASPDRVVLLSPQGTRLAHGVAKRLAANERLVLLCGRYEGVDERVREALADEELSVGDMVLTGGELAALMVVDAVARFLPGVLGRSEAADEDSFSEGSLEFPQYTRPARFRGLSVPEVLLSGDHGAVERWRAARSADATRTKRPDLIEGFSSGTAPRGRE
ncbi:MAG: tRNA (guanosine(37)-N1)-methyltransferase TrmD [Acidobacteriia bacterium]|nr:tRNA (guanosine(37)-N1)-methyltransferase TrmD [Terriglobia bacterium]